MGAKRTLPDVDRARFERARAALSAHGYDVGPGDELELRGPHGVVVAATFDDERSELRVEVRRKPLWIPPGRVFAEIERALARHT